MTSEQAVYHGDCCEVLSAVADKTFDAIVTDPPYGLKFMGHAWDRGVPGVAFWSEFLRVAKPGTCLLAFGGTRTWHRLACAIEDAGWEIRDTLMWMYGQGFPKSLDVSKAIDLAGGATPAEQARLLRARRIASGMTREDVASRIGCTAASVRDWEEGRARTSGGVVEFVVPSHVYRQRVADLLGYSADERLVTGVAAARTSDGTTLGLGHAGTLRVGGNTLASQSWIGWGTALRPAYEPIILARKPLVGTVADNVLTHGVGGLHIDACRIEVPDTKGGSGYAGASQRVIGRERAEDGYGMGAGNPQDGKGRWPANVVLDEEAAAMLDAQTGVLASGKVTKTYDDGKKVESSSLGMKKRALRPERVFSDAGGASRFFYVAKAPKSERTHNGQVENKHPTVKPISLMRWLVRLVTPPGGIVLDPFCGSGSTLVGCKLEGFDAIGIDQDEVSVRVSRERLAVT